MLLLAAAGVTDVASLPWLDAPPAQAVASAEKLLGWLGAFDERRRLTAVGRRMLDFPLHPRLARVVAEAEALGVGRDGATVAALLGERDLVATSFREGGPRTAHALGRDGTHSDVLAALAAYRGAEGGRGALHPARVAAVARAEKQIAGALRRGATDTHLLREEREEKLRQALLMGFPDRVGRLRRPSNDTRRSEREILFAGGGTGALAAESGVEGVDLVIAVDAEERHEGRGPRTLVRAASAIEADWLLNRFTDRIDDRIDVEWNEGAERAEVVRRLMFEGLALEEKAARPEGEALVLASKELARAARAKGWRSFVSGDDLDRFLMRVRFANKHCPDAGLPGIGEPQIEALLDGLCEGRRSFAELRGADFVSAIRNVVPPAGARRLAEIAPDAVVLPGGRKAKVTYSEGAAPFLESRLQDFFGMRQGPSAAMGRVPIVLHLLAPNYRAVQVTTDLAGFWERHYPGIARRLHRKYPRHATRGRTIR